MRTAPEGIHHGEDWLWTHDKAELVECVQTMSERLAASAAVLEGMTTEAKRHAEQAGVLQAKLNGVRDRAQQFECALATAHAHHMFGARPGCDDRMAALGYLRNHGLPEATAADLDAACEGLVTPWGSGPRTGAASKWVPTTTGTYLCMTVLEDLDEGWRDAKVYYEGGQLVTEKDGVGESVGHFIWLHPDSGLETPGGSRPGQQVTALLAHVAHAKSGVREDIAF